MVRWRSGLTHLTFYQAFMGSNPIRITICGFSSKAERTTDNRNTLERYH